MSFIRFLSFQTEPEGEEAIEAEVEADKTSDNTRSKQGQAKKKLKKTRKKRTYTPDQLKRKNETSRNYFKKRYHDDEEFAQAQRERSAVSIRVMVIKLLNIFPLHEGLQV